MSTGDVMIYVGVSEPFEVSVISPESDDDGMVLVLRTSDNTRAWVFPFNLKPVTP
jgi:hypothetical protein